MEALIRAIILGIVQGLTEFLPVSSSGHLEITKYLLQDPSLASQSLLMTIVLHGATAIATIIVYWKTILELLGGLFRAGWNDEKRFILYVVISMIPAAAAGILLDQEIESLFQQQVLLVGSMLLITGLLLLLADRVPDKGRPVNPNAAVVIGLAQAIAILPGISRSGATISSAVILGIDRDKAARFSFLMVVPLILGKILLDVTDGTLGANTEGALELAAGFIFALLTGILACRWMIVIVRKSKLHYFAIYCFIVGILAIAAHYTWN